MGRSARFTICGSGYSDQAICAATDVTVTKWQQLTPRKLAVARPAFHSILQSASGELLKPRTDPSPTSHGGLYNTSSPGWALSMARRGTTRRAHANGGAARGHPG